MSSLCRDRRGEEVVRATFNEGVGPETFIVGNDGIFGLHLRKGKLVHEIDGILGLLPKFFNDAKIFRLDVTEIPLIPKVPFDPGAPADELGPEAIPPKIVEVRVVRFDDLSRCMSKLQVTAAHGAEHFVGDCPEHSLSDLRAPCDMPGSGRSKCRPISPSWTVVLPVV